MLLAHRQSPNRERELREQAWQLAEARLLGRRICDICLCTVGTYEDRCLADEPEKCPGGRMWVEAYTAALREVGL